MTERGPDAPILVTGGTGHLGANLVRALLSRGDRVRVLVRPSSDRRVLAGLGVELFEGDLCQPDALRAAVRGCRAVFHTAAMISIRNGDRAQLLRTNVTGTRDLMRAALEAGVSRVVHTSSLGAIGTSRGGPSDESCFLDPFETAMDYERSKAQSEIVVFEAAARGLHATIVNPSAIVGPYDFRPSLVGRTIVDFGRGKLRAYVPGGFDWVPVRDVVAGHLLALDHGGRGERYILSGEQHSLDQIMEWLEEFTGVPKPRVRIPPRLMQNAALVKDWVERRFFPGVTPRFNYHSIRLLTSGKTASNEKAQRCLGLRPTPVRDAFRDAVLWFRDAGWF